MRIGLIAPPGVPVPPPAYGGTESVIDRLARGLVRAGHDVLLAAAANSACPVPRVEGTDEAAEAAPVCADTVTELRHVITSYAAMTGVDVVPQGAQRQTAVDGQRHVGGEQRVAAEQGHEPRRAGGDRGEGGVHGVEDAQSTQVLLAAP